MKIKSIQVTNFKQFENFSISCRDMNVLTGPNNAGKSSILDALRVCKDVLRFAAGNPPQMASQPGVGVCATHLLADGYISLSTENVARNYGDENAEIVLRHENGNSLTVCLHPNKRTKAFLQTAGRIPTSASQFRLAFPLDIVVVPTLSPFEAKENWVSDETTRKNEGTRLSSRSFRNIWLRKDPSEVERFDALLKQAWPNIDIQKPQVSLTDRMVEMYYLEGRTPREIHWAGFGFQVWLQMMTHIMRGTVNSVLVLDEPDIYLHPDLQRKLMRLIPKSFGQSFIATHSTEIINEANSGDILTIESKNKNARRITSEEGYRHVFSYLGSSENSEFARMARARRIVFFEGDDRRLLRRFAVKFAQAHLLDDPDTVFLKTGGFSQWKRVTAVGWTLENLFGMKIKIAALFDRDYRCSEEISEFLEKMMGPDILCHVLNRKEIENYALQEPVILRAMEKRAETISKGFSKIEGSNMIDEIFEEMLDEARSNTIGDFIRYHKQIKSKWSESTMVSKAMSLFQAAWNDRQKRFGLVCGKDFLSLLSSKFHSKIGMSITLAQIVNEMRVAEIPSDLVDVMGSIEAFFSNGEKKLI